MISGIEKTWLRNEVCFVIYGKSFEFFKKWEGDLTEAEIYSGTLSQPITTFDKGAFRQGVRVTNLITNLHTLE